MDASLAKELIENSIQMRIELHDMKRERNEIQQKYTALLVECEQLRKMLEMYSAEARREIDHKEFNIVEAIMEPVTSVNTDETETTIVNDDTHTVTAIIIDPIEDKKEKRKEYMRNYMRKKREAKANE